MKGHAALEHYLKHHALPNKLGRVIYKGHSHTVINAIRAAGLTPISEYNYRRLQAKGTPREVDDERFSRLDTIGDIK